MQCYVCHDDVMLVQMRGCKTRYNEALSGHGGKVCESWKPQKGTRRAAQHNHQARNRAGTPRLQHPEAYKHAQSPEHTTTATPSRCCVQHFRRGLQQLATLLSCNICSFVFYSCHPGALLPLTRHRSTLIWQESLSCQRAPPGHIKSPPLQSIARHLVFGKLRRHVVECLIHESGPLGHGVISFHAPGHPQLELEAVYRKAGHALLEVGVAY